MYALGMTTCGSHGAGRATRQGLMLLGRSLPGTAAGDIVGIEAVLELLTTGRLAVAGRRRAPSADSCRHPSAPS